MPPKMLIAGTIRWTVPRALLACLLALFVLPPAHAQARELQLSGVHPLTADSALVWSETQREFQVWRIEGAGKKGMVRWSEVVVPAELAGFKKSVNDYYGPQVSVNFGPDGAMRLSWIDSIQNTSRLYQAESQDYGKTWEVYRSELSEGMYSVRQVVMLDALHGWIILRPDSASTGQLPEMLATTADGGRIWTKVVGSSDRTQMPIGANGAQLLIANSANAASFVAAWFDRDGNMPLVAARTVDGGHTWSRTPISQDIPACRGCNVSALSGERSSRRAGDRCFDATFTSYDQASDAYVNKDARFCSLDRGITWLPPEPMQNPNVIIGDSGRGLTHATELPVYADAKLGFATVWGDHKAADWKDDGNPKDLKTWREYRLYETGDAGRTWSRAPASITNHYKPTNNIRVKQAEALGGSAWLLIDVSGDSPSSALFYSADHGATWKLLQTSATNGN